MRFTSLYCAAALLCLYPTVGFAQRIVPLVPLRRASHAALSWRDIFQARGTPINAFRDALSIRTETQLNGQPVAVVTNISSAPLFYEGYSGNLPSVYMEERQSGAWLPTDWDSCGTGIAYRLLLPGESRALSLRVPATGRKSRFWAVFSNRDDTFPRYVPELGFLYELGFLAAQPPRTSLVLLTPNGV